MDSDHWCYFRGCPVPGPSQRSSCLYPHVWAVSMMMPYLVGYNRDFADVTRRPTVVPRCHELVNPVQYIIIYHTKQVCHGMVPGSHCAKMCQATGEVAEERQPSAMKFPFWANITRVWVHREGTGVHVPPTKHLIFLVSSWTCCPMGVALSLNSAQELKHISLRAGLPPGPFYNFLSGRRCLHYQFRGDWFCCFTSFFSYEILNDGTYTHINIYFKAPTKKNSENSWKILEMLENCWRINVWIWRRLKKLRKFTENPDSLDSLLEKSSSNSLLPSNLPTEGPGLVGVPRWRPLRLQRAPVSAAQRKIDEWSNIATGF